jgi:hypothetical protein
MGLADPGDGQRGSGLAAEIEDRGADGGDALDHVAVGDRDHRAGARV